MLVSAAVMGHGFFTSPHGKPPADTAVEDEGSTKFSQVEHHLRAVCPIFTDSLCTQLLE